MLGLLWILLPVAAGWGIYELIKRNAPVGRSGAGADFFAGIGGDFDATTGDGFDTRRNGVGDHLLIGEDGRDLIRGGAASDIVFVLDAADGGTGPDRLLHEFDSTGAMPEDAGLAAGTEDKPDGASDDRADGDPGGPESGVKNGGCLAPGRGDAAAGGPDHDIFSILTAIERDGVQIQPVTITDFNPRDDMLAIAIQTGRRGTGGGAEEEFFDVDTRPTDDESGTEILLNGRLCATLAGAPGISASEINRVYI